MIDRIVFLFSPGPFGGAERVILSGAKRLKNCEIWIIKELRNPTPSDDFAQRCSEEKIAFSLFPCRSKFDLKTLKELKFKIKNEAIRFVHSHGLKANFYNAFLPIVRVATQHGRTSHNKKVRFLEYAENMALKRMDCVICVSEEMFKKKLYYKQVFLKNFLSFKVKKENYSLSSPIKLCAIGRLSPEKGLIDIIDIFKNDKRLELTLVGSGSEEQKLKASSKGASNIIFEGFQKDITPYLVHSDALIMPSHTEGLPMVLIEACAAGLPVIASNVGGIPSLVKANGHLFKAKDKNDILKSLNYFIENREILNKESQFFSKEVEKDYSIDHWLEQTYALYKSLL